jgi:hypothetical protein
MHVVQHFDNTQIVKAQMCFLTHGSCPINENLARHTQAAAI